jgi:hypothetical protein
MNCDKMMGGLFEKGLAQMKSVAEAAAKRDEQITGANGAK